MPRLTPVLFLVGLSFTPAVAIAQPRSVGRATQAELPQQLIVRSAQYPTELDQQRAQDTREELRRVMELYPPALGRVLKLDSTLMSNAAYLAPYPALATFLQRHPEVPRYPGYFLDFISDSNSYEPRDPESQVRAEAVRVWREIIGNMTVFAGFAMAILTVTWLIKYIVGHRRWLRATKIQSEVHGRLMERFSTNDELMAYVQSPAGSQFLKAAPVAVDTSFGTPAISAPFSRILWSVQAGLVLFCGGLGLLYVKQYMIEEVAQMLLVFGVLGVGVGAGFALAAGASYILSQRLGLFDSRRDGGATGA